MKITDWIVIAVVLGLLAVVIAFDLWIRKKYPDQ